MRTHILHHQVAVDQNYVHRNDDVIDKFCRITMHF